MALVADVQEFRQRHDRSAGADRGVHARLGDFARDGTDQHPDVALQGLDRLRAATRELHGQAQHVQR